MPYGMSFGKFSTFVAAAMITMFAGAQTVHVFYRPLDDLDEYVEKFKKERLEVKQQK